MSIFIFHPKICSRFYSNKVTIFIFIYRSWRSKRASVDFSTVHNEPKSKNPESAQELASASKPTEKDAAGDNVIHVIGIRVETSEREATYTDGGVPELMAYTKVLFRFFGSGFSEKTIVTLTEEERFYGGSCILPATGQFSVVSGSVTGQTMLVEMMMPKGASFFYFCTKNAEATGAKLVSILEIICMIKKKCCSLR